MIETKCFQDLNLFALNEMPTPDLLMNAPPVIEKAGCFPFRRKVIKFFFFNWLINELIYIVFVDV